MEEIIVFGKGDYYKFKEAAIREKYHIKCFLDNGNDSTKPEKCPVLRDYKIFIMSPKNIFQMTTQLIELGVNEENIISPMNLSPAFNEIERILIEKHGCFMLKDGHWHLVINNQDTEVNNITELKKVSDIYIREKNSFIDVIKNMPLEPASRRWGTERGTPIDRYYIEKFLEKNSRLIKGTVIEVSENVYTKRFGTNIAESLILHVDGRNNTLKGNLETGEGIEEEICDCLICTQTVQMIFNQADVFKNIYKMLKLGGYALITGHGTSPISMRDYMQWGEYWRYTPKTIEKLLLQSGFKTKDISIEVFGNVKVDMCFMYGLCLEDLSKEDLEYRDEQFPLIIGAIVRKDIDE